MGDLKETFFAFCDATKKGSTTCNDKTLKRICTDAKIYCKGFDQNRCDIQFRKHIGNTRKDVDFEDFVRFIEGPMAEAYMQARNIGYDEAVLEIKSKIVNAGPQGHGTTKVSKDDATARLTDVKGYTGASKERFDAETGKGKGIDGREYIPDKTAQAGYVTGYKGHGTYDEKHRD